MLEIKEFFFLYLCLDFFVIILFRKIKVIILVFIMNIKIFLYVNYEYLIIVRKIRFYICLYFFMKNSIMFFVVFRFNKLIINYVILNFRCFLKL